jgi:Ca-activated chloride channel family protein
MGLTPRYTSPVHPEEGVGVNPPIALPAETVGPVEIQIHVDLGVATGQPYSPSHTILADADGTAWQVQLAGPAIPDHDFVLRFPTNGADLHLIAWCSRDPSGETILLNWLPPASSQIPPAMQPRDFVFVLDRSGSMTGDPIRQARNALKACLRILEPQDTFRILLFDDQLEWYRSEAVHISQAEIDRADAYLDRVEGRGGTEIIAALEAGLQAPGDKNQTRTILFLTDGAISAEERALATLRKQAGQARIFTFGIGPSVNRALLTSLARVGRGSAEFLQLDEDIEGAILRFQDKIAFPMLTELQIDWTGCKTWDRYPEFLPDLYSGDALELTARLQRTSTASQVTLSGNRGGERIRISLDLPAAGENQAGVARAWARARVDALLEQMQSGRAADTPVRQEIIQLAIEHHLITPFTSFVAVDSQVVNAQGQSQTVQIAQPLPAGLNWSGFFPAPQIQFSRSILPGIPVPAFQTMRRMVADSSEDQLLRSMPGSGLPKRSAKQAGMAPPNQTGSESADAHPADIGAPDWQSVLRGLARSQKLNGSWNDNVELTAAALLAFIRHGHTPRSGNFRKQVHKARQWLEQAANFTSLAGYARCLALYELAQADQDRAVEVRNKEWSQRLPAPASPFERAVSEILNGLEKLPAAPGQCSTLDDLRLAVALQGTPTIEFPVDGRDPTNLTLVWWASLKAK